MNKFKGLLLIIILFIFFSILYNRNLFVQEEDTGKLLIGILKLEFGPYDKVLYSETPKKYVVYTGEQPVEISQELRKHGWKVTGTTDYEIGSPMYTYSKGGKNFSFAMKSWTKRYRIFIVSGYDVMPYLEFDQEVDNSVYYK